TADFGTGTSQTAHNDGPMPTSDDTATFLLHLAPGGTAAPGMNSYQTYWGHRFSTDTLPDGGPKYPVTQYAAVLRQVPPPVSVVLGAFNGGVNLGLFGGITTIQIADAGPSAHATYLAQTDPNTYLTTAGRAVLSATGNARKSLAVDGAGNIYIGGSF